MLAGPKTVRVRLTASMAASKTLTLSKRLAQMLFSDAEATFAQPDSTAAQEKVIVIDVHGVPASVFACLLHPRCCKKEQKLPTLSGTMCLHNSTSFQGAREHFWRYDLMGSTLPHAVTAFCGR